VDKTPNERQSDMKFELIKALIEQGYAPDSAIDEARLLMTYVNGGAEQ
jgi:hypothetical protein